MIDEKDVATAKDEILLSDNACVLLTEIEENLTVADDSAAESQFWKVMVATDDPAIDRAAKQALKNFCFEGKHLMVISACSAEEAKKIIADRPDIAVILLDAAIAIEDAGLQVVKYIREELKNQQVRLILCAEKQEDLPEESAIVDCEIDDCKLKVELTRPRLITTAIAALRSYRNVVALAECRQTVKQQKAQIDRALQQLKATRNRLIQAEKMSALSHSFAEFTNEIKQYLKFIKNGIHSARYYAEDLIDYIKLYSKIFPCSQGEIAEKYEEIDLKFILEDLPNLLLSMKLESTRIDEICAAMGTKLSQDDRAAKVLAEMPDDGMNMENLTASLER